MFFVLSIFSFFQFTINLDYNNIKPTKKEIKEVKKEIKEVKKVIKKKQVYIYFPNNSFECNEIYKVKKNKQKLIVNYGNYYNAKKCLTMFELPLDTVISYMSYIIKDDDKNYIKKLINYNLKNNIFSVIVNYNMKEDYLKNIYLLDLFNLYKERLTYNKLKFKLDYNNFKLLKIMKKNYNNLLSEYIKNRNIFFKENNIKQDLYKGWNLKNKNYKKFISSDGTMCSIYTSTEAKIFFSYLFDNIDYILGKTKKIDIERINNLKYYNSIYNYFKKQKIKKGKIGLTDKDIISNINSVSFGINNHSYYMGYINFNFFSLLTVGNERKNIWHSGLRICGFNNVCFDYWSDFGKYIKSTKTRKFLGKKEEVENGINIYFKLR